MKMKKNQFSYGRVAAAIVVIAVFACSIAWIKPAISPTDKCKSTETAAEAKQNMDSTTNMLEEARLIQLLEQDGLIDQVKGFVVEKKQKLLFIDGVQLPDSVAGKYTATLINDEIRVEVYQFIERLRQHPDAGFIQILFPVTQSSGCVDYKPKKKEGC